jgi:4-amino-4-deoxy-L-arabinose transferase-like glycosyltransferase
LSARRRDLAVLAGATFALRAAWVLVYGRISTPVGAINDTVFYKFASTSLAGGHGYLGLRFEPTAGWPPGFPFLMSLLFRAFGIHLKLALALNVALATATVVLLYLVVERMLDRRSARVAAGFFAILPGPLFMTGLFLSETLFIFMLVGFLALLVFLPDARWTALALGVALGLAALTRGEGLLMPIIPLAAWWGTLSRREWAARAALLLVAMALTVAPWTIRNAVVMDAFIPVANNASWTLWSGHNPRANGWIVNPEESPARSAAGAESETARAEQLRHEAIDWAVHNPLKELGLIPRRLLMLNQGSGGVIGGWLNAGERWQWELRTSSIVVFTVLADAFSYFLFFATVAAVVLLGPRRLWRAHRGLRAVLAYLALCLLNYGVVYYGQWRYRLPMEPFMIILAAPLLVRLWDERPALASALARFGPEPRPAGD